MIDRRPAPRVLLALLLLCASAVLAPAQENDFQRQREAIRQEYIEAAAAGDVAAKRAAVEKLRALELEQSDPVAEALPRQADGSTDAFRFEPEAVPGIEVLGSRGRDIARRLDEIAGEADRLDPTSDSWRSAWARRRVRKDLERVARDAGRELRRVKDELRRDPGSASARDKSRAIHGLLNEFAAIAPQLGESGKDVLETLAETLYGGDARIVENAPGEFSLWNASKKFAPVLVAHLPANRALDADSFDVPALAPPPALGSLAADRRRVRDVPHLAHLADALSDPYLTVAELFETDDLEFFQAPDPSVSLRRTHDENAAREADPNGVELSLISYNVALLDYKIFGFFSHTSSPLFDERKDDIARTVFAGGDDVIMLQEVWNEEELALVSKVARENGYRVFAGPRDAYTDGLVTFVKEDAIAEGSDPTHRAKAYEHQVGKEYWAAEITSLGFGTGVKRGYHEIGFVHKDLGPIKVFNTHMQPFHDGYLGRMRHGREMGLAAEAARADGSVVLMGGDLNAGPYYKEDVWTDDEGNETDGWWKNAISLPLLQHYSNGDDLVVAGRPSDEATADVDRATMEDPPGTDPEWPFTATSRSNELHDKQYGSSEYRARLDHILGNGGGRIKVTGSEMVFTDDIEVAPGVISELSDHYGVRSRVVIAPPRR